MDDDALSKLHIRHLETEFEAVKKPLKRDRFGSIVYAQFGYFRVAIILLLVLVFLSSEPIVLNVAAITTLRRLIHIVHVSN